MPHLRIGTNLPRSKIPAGVEHELCKVLSETIGKPLNVCMVTISPDKIMSIGGTNDPCAQATLMSIGKLGVAENKRHSKAISEKVESSLGISPDNLVIHFMDAKPSEIGTKGTTVDDMLHLV